MPYLYSQNITELWTVPSETPFKITGMLNEHGTYIIPHGQDRLHYTISVREINELRCHTLYRRALVTPL